MGHGRSFAGKVAPDLRKAKVGDEGFVSVD
jgi:hypothetical protein